MEKRGLNQVITIVLIILVILVAIGIIWAFISPVVQNSSRSITSEQYTANFEIVDSAVLLNESEHIIILKVERKAGGVTPTKMVFALTDTAGQVRSFTLDTGGTFNELETKSFTINYTGSDLGEPARISVAGVFTINDREQPGVFTDSYDFGTFVQQQTLPVIEVCGNGAVESGEACDDGNVANGDGCSSVCAVEPFSILITAPADGSTYGSTALFLNYTITSSSAPQACWYSSNSGVTNTTITCGTNVTNLMAGIGANTWKVYANMSDDRIASDTTSFTVTIGAPGIVLNAPIDGLRTNAASVNFDYTPTAPGTSSISSCSLFGDLTGTYQSIQTDTSITTGINTFTVSPTEGIHLWAVSCITNLGSSSTTTNRSLIIDRTAPIVSLTVPQPADIYAGTAVMFVASLSEQGTLTYNLDGGPTLSMSSSDGLSFTANSGPLADGAHSITVHGTDQAGNTANVGPRTFTIDNPPAPTCMLSNPHWDPAGTVVEGAVVPMVVDGQNCNGQVVTFEVYEDDTFPAPNTLIGSYTGVFSGNTATRSWTSQWMDDGLLQGDPEYFFTAAVGTASVSGSEASVDELHVMQAPPVAVCGNGAVESGEACDDGNTITETSCGVYGGSGNYCNAACTAPITLSCPRCGDLLVNGPEVCDGGSQACTVTGGYSGTRTCNPQCNGFGSCASPQFCGDGIVNGNEQCDGSVSITCQQFNPGFTGGTLACSASCTINTAACTAAPGGSGSLCGNGICDPGEEDGGSSDVLCPRDCEATGGIGFG